MVVAVVVLDGVEERKECYRTGMACDRFGGWDKIIALYRTRQSM